MFSLEKNNALFLNFDGTLVDIADNPGDIKVPNSLKTSLSLLRKKLNDAVCIITSRSEKDLKKWIYPANVYIAAENGAVLINTSGIKYYTQAVYPELEELKEEVEEFCKKYDGVLCEEKDFGIAVHCKANLSLKPKIKEFLKTVSTNNTQQLDLEESRMVLELKQQSMNKGEIIEILMQTTPFKNRIPVFIGYDKADETGFKTVNKMGGQSVKVGEGQTEAKYRLNSASECLNWLKDGL